jgi:hypothetical protein
VIYELKIISMELKVKTKNHFNLRTKKERKI